MACPTDKLLPWRAPLVPFLLREEERILLLLLKQLVQLPCDVRVDDNGIFLAVPTQRASIEVGRADGTKLSIDHDDLRMMEPRLVEPDVATFLHQLMSVVETHVGCDGNVAPHAQHDFHLHPPLDSFGQGTLQLTVKREVGIDKLDAFLRVVDSIEVEEADDVLRHMRLTVDDAHHLLATSRRSVRLETFHVVGIGDSPVIFCTMNVLSRDQFPHSEEDLLQRIDLIALDTAMHIVPAAHLLRSFDIIVGNIHSPRIGHLAVDDDDLSVVAVEEIMDPWESQGLKLIDLHPFGSDETDVRLAHRLVVAGVAKTIENSSDLYALRGFAHKTRHQLAIDGVVAEVEILKMDARPGLFDRLEEVVKLLLSSHEQGDGVVVGKCHPFAPQLLHHQAICPLCPPESGHKEQRDQYDYFSIQYQRDRWDINAR